MSSSDGNQGSGSKVQIYRARDGLVKEQFIEQVLEMVVTEVVTEREHSPLVRLSYDDILLVLRYILFDRQCLLKELISLEEEIMKLREKG